MEKNEKIDASKLTDRGIDQPCVSNILNNFGAINTHFSRDFIFTQHEVHGSYFWIIELEKKK